VYTGDCSLEEDEMPQTIRIRLERDGEAVPINGVVADGDGKLGLIVDNETSASPRPFRFFLTSRRKSRRRQIHGIRLELKAVDGELRLQTRGEDRIPDDNYIMKFKLEDTKFEKIPSLDIEDGLGEVKLTMRRFKDKINVYKSLHKDELLEGVLSRKSPKIDKKTLSEWIDDETRRPKRRACFLNLLAKLRALPTPDEPLISYVRYFFFVDVDRVYAAVEPKFHDLLEKTDNGTGKFLKDPGNVHSTHVRLLDHIKRKREWYVEDRLVSYREDAMPSEQAVVAVPEGNEDEVKRRLHYADLDIDLASPYRDLLGVVVHLGEILDDGRTDHLKMWKKLRKKKELKKHLHYSVS
jgi:hypothetical protein